MLPRFFWLHYSTLIHCSSSNLVAEQSRMSASQGGYIDNFKHFTAESPEIKH